MQPLGQFIWYVVIQILYGVTCVNGSMMTMDSVKAEAAIEVWDAAAEAQLLASVHAARRVRRAARSTVTKSVKRLTVALGGTDLQLVKACRVRVEDAMENLLAEDQKIWELMDDDHVIAADDFLGESYHDAGIKAVSAANAMLDSISSSSAAPAGGPTPAAPPVASRVKLPKMDLPKFAGDSPAEFQTFWNTFESLINCNTSLSDVEKLQYLKNCCSGEAGKVANGYMVTSDNYKNLVDALKGRYGLPRLVQQSHIELILDLQPFKADSLEPFLNTLEASLRSLAGYGVHAEHLAPFIVPHVERLMPEAVYTKWKELIHADTSFSTTKLISFLHEKVQCYKRNGNGKKNLSTQKDDSGDQNVKPKTTSLLATTAKETNCICCGKAHNAQDCPSFKELPQMERIQLAKRGCWKCLQPGYNREHTCKFKARCEICNSYGHHTLIHGMFERQERNGVTASVGSAMTPQEKQPDEAQDTPDIHESEEIAQVATNALHHKLAPRENMTVLKSFSARPRENLQYAVRSALDGGSHKTWILEKTARALNLPVIRRSLMAVATALSEEYDTPKLYDIVKVNLQTVDGGYFECEAVVSKSNKLIVDVDPINFNPCEIYAHLEDIHFADIYPRQAAEVELLIGNDYADLIETGAKRKGRRGQPFAINTIFGWVLSGKVEQKATQMAVNNLSVTELEDKLEEFKDRNLCEESDNFTSVKTVFLKQQNVSANLKKQNQVLRIFAEQVQQGNFEKLSDDKVPIGEVFCLPKDVISRLSHFTSPQASFSARKIYLKNCSKPGQIDGRKNIGSLHNHSLDGMVKKEEIEPGSLVLLKRENRKYRLWPMARVVESHTAHDGYVRSVTLKDYKNKLIRRPIQNLVLLEGYLGDQTSSSQ